MSEIIEEIKKLTFTETVPIINDKYLIFLETLIEKFKYHDELYGSLQNDLKLIKDKLLENNYHVIDIITDNFLFCLEQIYDNNVDYFVYQKEKIPKKNGKTYKNKLPKLGNKTLIKRLLKELDNSSTESFFKNIIYFFDLIIIKDNENYLFNEDYIIYVKNNFVENKNFSKMIMVFDNINNIFNSNLEEVNENQNEDVEEETPSKDKSKSKNKSKGKSKSKQNDFMKNLETTKIAQLAKNISEKINLNDFPALSDPSKLLSSLGNSSDEGGIQNLLKFVVGEVEQAFKNESLNEKDLMGEAQNIMGQFQNMSGFDPLSLLNNNKDNIDLSQFANIFSNMGK